MHIEVIMSTLGALVLVVGALAWVLHR